MSKEEKKIIGKEVSYRSRGKHYRDEVGQNNNSYMKNLFYRARKGESITEEEQEHLLEYLKQNIKLGKKVNKKGILYYLNLDDYSLKITSNGSKGRKLTIYINQNDESDIKLIKRKGRKLNLPLNYIIAKSLNLWLRDEIGEINDDVRNNGNQKSKYGTLDVWMPPRYENLIKETKKKAKEKGYSFSSVVRAVLRKYKDEPYLFANF